MARSFISVILTVLLSVPAYAGEVGRMTYVEGRVDLFSPGSDKAAYVKEGSPVNVGDSIRVKSNSRAEVTFADKSVVRIAQNSKLDVSDYKLDDSNNRKTATLRLERGKMRTIIAKMKDAAEFRIDTPNAEGTVKGSDIFTFYQGGSSGMLVSEGVLSVFNPAVADTVISVPSGSAVTVPLKNAPGAPRDFMDIEKKIHESDTAIPDNISSRKKAAVINGTITKMTGDVKVSTKGSSQLREAKVGDVLEEGSKVITGKNGIVEISFDNGNAIYLKPNSDIIILRLIVDSKTGEYENIFQSEKGSIKGRIEKLSGKSKFEIKTPTGICGARGTIMYLNIAPNGDTQAFFEGGSGYVTNLISGQTIEIPAGGGGSTDSSGGASSNSGGQGGGQGGGGSGVGSGGGDDGFDPSGGTPGAGSGDNLAGGGTDGGAGGGSTSFGSDVTGNGSGSGTEGLQGGEVIIPITVSDPGVLNPPAPALAPTPALSIGSFYYSDPEGSLPSLQSAGSLYSISMPAYFPGVASPWGGKNANFSLSGNYALTSANTYLIFTTDGLHSYDSSTSQYTTSEGGAFYSFVCGAKNSGDMNAQIAGVYIDKLGNAGTMTGSCSGNDMASFSLDGIATFTEEQISVGVAPDALYSHVRNEGSFYGAGRYDIGAYSYAIANLTSGSEISIDTGGAFLDWGVWSGSIAGKCYKDSYDTWPGSFYIGLAGSSEDSSGRVEGGWLHYASITWAGNKIDISSEISTISVHSDGTIHGEYSNGGGFGNYVTVPDGQSGGWQASLCGVWHTKLYDSGTRDYLRTSDFSTTGSLFMADLIDINPGVSVVETVTTGGGLPLIMTGSGSFGAGGSVGTTTLNMRMYKIDPYVLSTNNGIWAATLSGTYSGTTGSGWSAVLTESTNSVTLTGTEWGGVGNGWRADVSGTVDGKTVSGVAAGKVTDTDNFTGAAVGEWTA